jgi:hypothetical protein
MLTLILSSVESLGTELKSKGNSVNKEINLMYNNSKVTSINQSIRLRKVEDKKFILRLQSLICLIFQIVLLRILKKRNSISISP